VNVNSAMATGNDGQRGQGGRRGPAPQPKGNVSLNRIAAVLLLAVAWLSVCRPAGAEETAIAGILFQGREIHLQQPRNQQVTFGRTGSTAGRAFIPLAGDAGRQALDLGKLGYWEKVADPPSFLRNTDLQVMVHDRTDTRFRIELAYDGKRRHIRFRVLEGAVAVRLDDSDTIPLLTIVPTGGRAATPAASLTPPSGSRIVIFDFNSFDGDLKPFYGRIKRLMQDSAAATFFYCYEADGYDPYFFKVYRDPGKLDTAKMGLSLEDGSLAYYQKVLENLKARQGDQLNGRLTLVSRFGGTHAVALNRFARDIGIAADGDIRFQSYSELE
jgi:hypothetical protein